MKGQIRLQGMAFYGYHGHHPAENERGQRFLVDVLLTLDISEAARSDRLSEAVDYARVYEVCRRIMEGERLKLLESLCRRVIEAILAEFPKLDRVEVTVKKPSAPIPGVLDYVAITAAADRNEGLSRARE